MKKAIALFAGSLSLAVCSLAHAEPVINVEALKDHINEGKEKISKMISSDDSVLEHTENGKINKNDVLSRLNDICSEVDEIEKKNEQRIRYVNIFPEDENLVRESNDATNDITALKTEYHTLLRNITLPYIKENIEIPVDIYHYMESRDKNKDGSGIIKGPKYKYCFKYN